MPKAVACPTCGGPIEPPAGQVRTRCPYCGATVDVTSHEALKAAAVLDRLGIRVPDNPMTVDQIREEMADRERESAAQRQTAIIVAGVVIAIAAVLGLAIALLQ